MGVGSLKTGRSQLVLKILIPRVFVVKQMWKLGDTSILVVGGQFYFFGQYSWKTEFIVNPQRKNDVILKKTIVYEDLQYGDKQRSIALLIKDLKV